MTKGRKKTPTAILERRGSNKVRYRAPEPQAVIGQIIAPKNLDDLESQVFDYYAGILTQMGVASTGDSMAIELLARTYAEYYRLDEFIKRNGRTVSGMTEDGKPYEYTRPEVKMMNDARNFLAKLLPQLGLTPASRPNIHPADSGTKKVEMPMKKLT